MEITDAPSLRAGRLEIRPAEHTALIDGRPLNLTVRELDLLTAFVRNADRVLTREELSLIAWQREHQKRDRSVDVYVGRLRTKLARSLGTLALIHTHTGVGYRFSPDP
jgi:DNA-binding response OmpR family regulator